MARSQGVDRLDISAEIMMPTVRGNICWSCCELAGHTGRRIRRHGSRTFEFAKTECSSFVRAGAPTSAAEIRASMFTQTNRRLRAIPAGPSSPRRLRKASGRKKGNCLTRHRYFVCSNEASCRNIRRKGSEPTTQRSVKMPKRAECMFCRGGP